MSPCTWKGWTLGQGENGPLSGQHLQLLCGLAPAVGCGAPASEPSHPCSSAHAPQPVSLGTCFPPSLLRALLFAPVSAESPDVPPTWHLCHAWTPLVHQCSWAAMVWVPAPSARSHLASVPTRRGPVAPQMPVTSPSLISGGCFVPSPLASPPHLVLWPQPSALTVHTQQSHPPPVSTR